MAGDKRESRVALFLKGAGTKKYDGKIDWMIWATFEEEVEELLDAIRNYNDAPTTDARAHLCKEWADTQYTLSGLAWYFDIPADAAFNRVADNNLTKLGPNGEALRRADGKILKPEGYQKPDMAGL